MPPPATQVFRALDEQFPNTENLFNSYKKEFIPTPPDTTMDTDDHNPQLNAWRHARSVPDAGTGTIHLPGTERNLRWQNRTRVPTERERRLADAVVRIYGEGGRTPAQFAERLNALLPDTRWNAAAVEAEFARLAD